MFLHVAIYAYDVIGQLPVIDSAITLNIFIIYRFCHNFEYIYYIQDIHIWSVHWTKLHVYSRLFETRRYTYIVLDDIYVILTRGYSRQLRAVMGSNARQHTVISRTLRICLNFDLSSFKSYI